MWPFSSRIWLMILLSPQALDLFIMKVDHAMWPTLSLSGNFFVTCLSCFSPPRLQMVVIKALTFFTSLMVHSLMLSKRALSLAYWLQAHGLLGIHMRACHVGDLHGNVKTSALSNNSTDVKDFVDMMMQKVICVRKVGVWGKGWKNLQRGQCWVVILVALCTLCVNLC